VRGEYGGEGVSEGVRGDVFSPGRDAAVLVSVALVTLFECFTFCIHTENQDQAICCPSAPRELSVLPESPQDTCVTV